MSDDHIIATIETLLKKLSINFDRIEFLKTTLHDTYLIHTQDAGILIGSRGENLEAFSYLARRMIEKGKEEGEEQGVFVIDVNNYQTKKIQELVESVQLSARRAKLFRQNVELPPMSSYERMIIHSVFSDDPDITTESEGEGKFRRVILKYVTTIKQPKETTPSF